jgi:hypothetical protein
MVFRKSLSSGLGIALSEQILSNQSFHMPCVSRDSLDSDFVRGARDPVLGVFRPVSEDLLVDFVSRSFVAIDSR